MQAMDGNRQDREKTRRISEKTRAIENRRISEMRLPSEKTPGSEMRLPSEKTQGSENRRPSEKIRGIENRRVSEKSRTTENRQDRENRPGPHVPGRSSNYDGQQQIDPDSNRRSLGSRSQAKACRPKDQQAECLTKYTVPLDYQKLVMVKIGDSFLRLGNGRRPIISRLRPPMHPNLEPDVASAVIGHISAVTQKRPDSTKRFNYQDFTFVADQSCTMTKAWYQHVMCYYHVRFGVKRKPEEGGSLVGKEEYLCAVRNPDGQLDVRYDTNPFGSWWRLTAVSTNQYVAESMKFPGQCLMRDSTNQLALSRKITQADRVNITKGSWDKWRTVTIIELPDFAVWRPGVTIN